MTDPRRYSLIDAIRAVAVINMILYHLLYDVFCVFGVWDDFYIAVPSVIWERAICVTFILISGVSMNFSRRGVRRGLLVLLCGLLISVVTILLIPDQMILFGVLSFLGCAMLLTCALRRWLDRIPPLIGTIVFFLLFMLCYGIPQGFVGIFSVPLIRLPEALYQYKWLSVIGFLSKDFYSADYFPILQWIFLYLFGFALWRFIASKQLDRFFTRRIPVLDLIGRHSLIIYMAHQPLLYGVCWLIFTRLI